MSFLEAIALGILQGATEFLPVSSSAHLALTHWITGWQHSPDADLTFDVALHFGTLLAILIYFARDWFDFLKRRDRIVAYVLLACIPGALAGAKFEELAGTAFRDPRLIAALLAVMGLVMAAAEKWGPKRREIEGMSLLDAIWIGLSQALAIMPGVSRSGITMTTGLFLGLSRQAAARFSFLLATPILLGATLWKCRHILHGTAGIGAAPMILGVLTSAIVGLACISFLMSFLRRHSFYPFVIYRLALAAVVLVLTFFHGR
jgi:undecaprenyl-diphosphatase